MIKSKVPSKNFLTTFDYLYSLIAIACGRVQIKVFYRYDEIFCCNVGMLFNNPLVNSSLADK